MVRLSTFLQHLQSTYEAIAIIITVVSAFLQHLQSTYEAIATVINKLQAMQFQIKAVYSTFILEMKVAWHLLFFFQACPSYRLWLQLVLEHQNTEWRAVMATLHSKHVNLPFFIPAPNSSFLVKECLGFTASFLLPPVVGCRLKMESSGHLWLLCLLLLWWVYLWKY